MICFWLLLAIAGLLGRSIFLFEPPNSDSSLFVFMGKMAATTGVLGSDLLDTKFHSVGMLLSLPWRAFGGAWWMWGVLGMVMASAAAWCLAKAVDDRNAFWPTFAVAMLTLSNPSIVGGLFQLETILILGTSASAMFGLTAMRQKRFVPMFVAGLIAGTAALAKPSALGVVVALALSACLVDTNWRTKLGMISSLLAGLVAPAITFLAYPIITNTWGDFLFILEQIRLYSAGGSRDPSLYLRVVIIGGLLIAPATVAWLHHRRWKASPAVVFAALWLSIELAGVLGQARLYAYHFLVLAPPTVLMFGLAARHIGFKQQLRAAAIAVVLLTSQTAATWINRQPDAMGPAIRDVQGILSRTGGTVWSDDWSRMAIELDAPAPSRVPLLFLLTIHDDAPRVFGDRVLDDLRTTRPSVLVLPTVIQKHVRLMLNHNREFKDFARRGEGLASLWTQIAATRDANYRLVSTHGRFGVYERVARFHID